MVRVFVWHAKLTFSIKEQRAEIRAGHAAMQVDHTYISWWPDKPAGIKSFSPPFYEAPVFRNQTNKRDKELEREDSIKPIELSGLDEKAIKDWWQGFGLTRDGQIFQGPLPSWKLTQNCSTVVANGLLAGGAEKYCIWPKQFYPLIWAPDLVFLFAKCIKAGLDRKR